MISVQEALNIIEKHLYKSKSKHISIQKCLGYILAEDVFSKIDMPPFPQSAMDGYALKLHNAKEYNIIGEIKAGDSQGFTLEKGEALRIFTGAPVPSTANAVIMQEKTKEEKSILQVEETPSLYSNIRPQGEQIKKGELAVKKGIKLTPSAISFLVSLGVQSVAVYDKPKVAIVVTGSELVDVEEELTYGKIYESNSILLKNSLIQKGIANCEIYKVKDDYQSTLDLLDQVTKENDFVLVSGGISVGDYDFVGKALTELNTEKLFYKIKQKPGKPLFFGKRKKSYVFALPGNPASALTCFTIYALPMLLYFMGNESPFKERVKRQLSHDYQVKGIRAQFLKAKVKGNNVEVLSQQSSAMISGFIEANAYVFVPEYSDFIKKDTSVEVIMLD